ncbi:MAG TPA: hypothetical protein P5137_00480 [Candidatus Brocadiia bacterium]|nr:hypothetical protein [Candidatus Brocadiia bacterium]
MAGIVAAARAYLQAENEAEREPLRPGLEAYDGDLDEVAAALRPKPPEEFQTGWLFSQPFRSARLAGKHPQQPVTYFVPPDYRPDQPRGLVIFLHGGARGSGDHGIYMYKNTFVNDVFEESGRIVCFPSAPASETCGARWNLPEADAYIADVIEEAQSLYAIDVNDVVLGGSSMGGMGAYHMAHLFADRFSSVFCSAGAWDFACWPALAGTTIWIMHGRNDACLYRRRHYTDVAFARAARLRLVEAGVDHVYREHAGGHHLLEGRWFLREWLEWARDKRRDPYYPHVVAVTPRGLTAWSDYRRHHQPPPEVGAKDFTEAPHARWVTIEGVGQETIQFDMMSWSGCRDEAREDWDNVSFAIKRKHIRGGLVEARIHKRKTIEVTPKNVTAFSLWLHPRMVDFNDARVVARSTERFRGPLRPSLATMLDSYLRRRDWGMLYTAKVTIADDGTWPTKDQLKLGLG